ncbi:serine/threonine-protein kinase ATG1t isoform X4 [Sesamum indicum]|uniref:Serine/threonine-protein kinase ATG1t isoform X4 n=1 Tax=Sesamum indicum TaxID=4182 RepID=A0A8M8V7K6_SESIN|nr:serine/threonine-protein kinase ATG1t isoform X4 [Sesamum indicum]
MGENFENSNFQEQSLGDYVLRSKLGESSLSTVWRAEHRTTGEVVALKQIPLAKLTRHLRNCLDCELTFLSSVNHPNIIRLLDFFEYEGSIILALEFCAGGNLASYIQHHGRVQECVAKRFMQQLGAGLKVLKQNHIVHRDLKPEVDMWSVGAILFELLNGYPPFHGRSSVQLLQNIKASTSLPFCHLILPHLHPDCIDLCSRLLSINPDDRLSSEEFYQHNFLQL